MIGHTNASPAGAIPGQAGWCGFSRRLTPAIPAAGFVPAAHIFSTVTKPACAALSAGTLDSP